MFQSVAVKRFFTAAALAALAFPAVAEEELPVLYVTGQRVATDKPASTYAAPVTLLELDPRVDIQVRNIAEAQGDVTLRGGTFESTGFSVGGAILFDPQTGHYAAEIPIATEMLTRPAIRTGVDNALLGFNSTVGTVQYDWSPIHSGGQVTGAAGDHRAHYERLHAAHLFSFDSGSQWHFGVEGELSRSLSDGTIRYGDHDFRRSNLRLEMIGPRSQTDLFVGDQYKFFGWFGMYTGAAYKAFDPFETERLKTRLYLLSHRQTYGAGSNWQAGAYYRRNQDHYIFDRFAPNQAFVHETTVGSLSLNGDHAVSDRVRVMWSAMAARDRIESTTLEHTFTTRRYARLAVVPQYTMDLRSGAALETRVGATFDNTSEDESALLPLAEIAWLSQAGRARARYSLSFSETTRVPGYTAIGGPTAGLFASNPALGRERSRNVEFALLLTSGQWSAEGAMFRRWDDDLADWTYSRLSPNARTANPVDVEVTGVELVGSREWRKFELLVSLTHLVKAEDYGAASVDASFYALNYPRNRITAAAIWYPSSWAEVRVDNEWRVQRENALREGSDHAFYTHMLVTFSSVRFESWHVNLAAENLWNDRFQEVPGTPGRGRQITASLSWSW